MHQKIPSKQQNQGSVVAQYWVDIKSMWPAASLFKSTVFIFLELESKHAFLLGNLSWQSIALQFGSVSCRGFHQTMAAPCLQVSPVWSLKRKDGTSGNHLGNWNLTVLSSATTAHLASLLELHVPAKKFE